MKQDEIIEMAREAGLYQDINVSFHQALRNFYDLVAAKEQKKWQDQTAVEIHEAVLYTHQPQSFTYEQVKAHIRAASMSANDISVGSDTTEDGVSIVIRRRDEILYAEFFAYTTPPQRTWVELTDEEWLSLGCKSVEEVRIGLAIQAKLKELNT
jgi:hypothetical protein